MASAAQPVYVNARRYEAVQPRILELHADYACGNTGLCCREPWGIPLIPSDLTRLKGAMSATGMDTAEIDRHFVAGDDPKNPEHARFAANQSGHCIFLGGDTGNSCCTAHRAHGHQKLPTVCQSFPRLAVRSPAGVYLTLTYACPTAARLLSRPDGLAETVPRRVLAHHPDLAGTVLSDTVEPPEFSSGHRPTWSAFDYFWRWTPEWIAQSGLRPAEALYGLGRIVARIEELGKRSLETAALIDLLDSTVKEFPPQIRAFCDTQVPATELGVIYMDALMNFIGGIDRAPAPLRALWGDRATEGPGKFRERVGRAYDQIIRPRLREFELIERNYIGSRLYANPLAYRATVLRTGYFIGVLSFIGLRFCALAICAEEGKPLDESILHRAAGITDKIFLHEVKVQTHLLELTEQRIRTDMQNLCFPCLF